MEGASRSEGFDPEALPRPSKERGAVTGQTVHRAASPVPLYPRAGAFETIAGESLDNHSVPRLSGEGGGGPSTALRLRDTTTVGQAFA